MHTVTRKPPFIFAYVVPCYEAYPADDYEQHNGDIYERVVGEGRERGEFSAFAHQIETRVAESGYRMENAVPYTFTRAESLDERGHHHECADKLEYQYTENYEAVEFNESFEVRRGDGFAEGTSFLEVYFFTRSHSERHGERNHAHSADLYQNEDDCLTEARPIQSRVFNYETGDADCGSGGEKRVEKRGAAPVSCRKGKHQQETSEKNDRGETNNYYLKRR